jgi:hypothetical protein
MHSETRARSWWHWQYVRWIFLLPGLAVAFVVGLLALFFVSYLLQFPYFRLLDATHRHASSLGDSFVSLGLGGLAGLLVGSSICWASLVAISPGLLRKAKSAFKWAGAVILVWCLVVVAGVVQGSAPDREIPFATPEWTVKLPPIFTISPGLHTTHKMILPDANHVVVNTGNQLESFDIRSRRVVANRQVKGRDPQLFASSSGKVIVSTGDQLDRFSADLQPDGSSFPIVDGFAELASPSGARIAWQHYAKTPPKVTFVDTETLKTAETFATCNAGTMTDRSVAESVILVDEGSVPAINVCEPGTAQHILYRGDSGSFVYLNNESMLMVGNRLLLLDSAGRVRARDDWPKQQVEFAGASRDGSRFAIAIQRWGWGDPAKINKVTIVIYDTASFRPIARVASKWVSVFSPDGKAVVASSGADISYIRLP